MRVVRILGQHLPPLLEPLGIGDPHTKHTAPSDDLLYWSRTGSSAIALAVGVFSGEVCCVEVYAVRL